MRMILVLGLLTGCEQMPATGDPLKPVAPSSAPAAATPDEATPETPADADPFADERTEEGEEDVPTDPVALLAMQQGVDVEDLPTPEPMAEPTPIPEPVPVAAVPVTSPVPAPMPAWDPATAPPTPWGIRLLSTLNATNPPRAVVGLPNGSEVVVQPGQMLPEQNVVVMAIGNEVVQIAQVIPDGYQARVETHTLSSLFPQNAQ